MAKGKKQSSTKPAAPMAQAKPKSAAASGAVAKGNVSDALRQAIKDLGGDDDDLELIAGVDSDDEEAADKPKGKDVDEKSMKKELSEFMKLLDFAAVGGAPVAAEAEEEDEDEDEEEDDDEDEGEDEDDEEEDDVDEDEDEGEKAEAEEESDGDEDEESEDESEDAPVKPTAKATAPKPAPVKSSDSDPNSGSNLPPVSAWWTLVPELATPSKPLGKAPFGTVNNLRQRSERLLANLPKPNRAGSSSDAAFISQILSSGTHQDKLSALVLLVRESPIHAIAELERLRNMAGWRDGAPHNGGGRDQRMATVRALADWWVTGGGKEAGKLKYFADQPLLAHPDITDRHLVVYAYEDFLKKWFFNVLQILEVLSHDTLPYVRMKALDVMFQLLSGNAEQEQNLLRLGVNKLGDADRAVASKTSHHILQLLQVHPAMKAVVAREVTAIVLKTTLTGAAGSSNSGAHIKFDDGAKTEKKEEKKDANAHGRYYGLITLNQMTLTSKDKDVAGRLVEVYFEVFREILGEEQAKGDDKKAAKDGGIDEKVTGKVDKWRGRRKGAKPKGGRKAAQEDELVESSEAKLVAAVLTGINRALPFASIDEELFTNYMETLFKICHAGTFNTSIQALQLIFQVCQSRQAVSDRFYRTLYESLFDGRLLTSSKQAMYLNLLFKALKADKSLPRVMAFVKRLLQMLGMHQPPFICGALYLLGELFDTTPGLRRMLIEPEDDGEEHFVDADKKTQPQAETNGESSSASATRYDGKKREPLYAHADSSCLWELVPFLNHFHPSVSLQASQLLMGQPLTGSPDISLNTLISFLDKFVYRNPKKTVQPKGASIMQPAAVVDQHGAVVRSRGARTDESAYVNSEVFWRKKVEDVPVDQLFFHKFFSAKLAKKEAAKKKGAASDEDEDMSGAESADELPSDIADMSDDEDDDEGGEGATAEGDESDPEEAEIWKAMQASMPDAGDDMGLSDDSSDEDVDVDYSDSDEDEVAAPAADEDEDEDEAAEDASDSDSDSDGAFDFDDDEDDLIPLDEVPEVQLDATPEPEEEDEDAEAGAKRKRREERKERRKKRREAPAFASYDDYAALIEQGGDSD